MKNDDKALPNSDSASWIGRLDLPRLTTKRALLAASPGGDSIAVADGGHLALQAIGKTGDDWSTDKLWDLDIPDPVSSLILTGDRKCVFSSHRDQKSTVIIADKHGLEEIASFPAGPSSLCLLDDCVAIALPASTELPARVCVINLGTGAVIRTIHVPSRSIAIRCGRDGRTILVTDKQCARSWVIGLKDCGARDNDPAIPGTVAVDVPGGGIVSGNPGGVICHYPVPRNELTADDTPTSTGADPACQVRIDFDPKQLLLSGKYIIAIAASGRQFAVLHARNLEILTTRRFGSAGAAIVAGAGEPLLLSFDWSRHVWERFDIDAAIDGRRRRADFDDPEGSGELSPDAGDEPDGGEVVFVGRTTAPLLDGRVPPRGTMHTLVLPLLEAGQSFGSSDLTPLHSFLSAEVFPVLTSYFEENSYFRRSPEDGVTITFDTLGIDFLPDEPPLRLPDTYENYFFGSHEAGGFETTINNAVTPLNLILEGPETLSLRVAHPDIMPAGEAVLNLSFAALAATASFPAASTTLRFDGSEEMQLVFRDAPDAAPSVQMVRFTEESFEIRASNPEPELRRLETYLGGLLSGAAAPPFELVPRVRQIDTGSSGFGDLHVDFSFQGPPESRRFVAAVHVVNDPLGTLATVGLASAATGRFQFAHDVFNDAELLQTALARSLRHAEIDASLMTGGMSVFHAVDVLAGTSLRVRFELEGFESGRSITLESQDGLEPFGLDAARSIFDSLESSRPIDNERLPPISFHGNVMARVAARASRGSSALILTVPFEAAHGPRAFRSAPVSLPATVNFSGAEIELSTRDEDGSFDSVTVDFPDGSEFEIDEASLRTDLQRIETFVNDRIAAASPAHSVEIRVRHLRDARGDLGFFSFASFGDPAGSGRSISSSAVAFGGGGPFTLGLDVLQGWNNEIDGSASDREGLRDRLGLAMASAAYDASRPIGTSVFKTPTVSLDRSTNAINIVWSLADEFGEGAASAEVLEWHPDLLQLGFDNVDTIVGGAAGFDARNTVRRFSRGGGSPGDRDAPIFGDDIVSELLDRAGDFDDKTRLAERIEREYESVMLLIVGPAPSMIDGRALPAERQWTAGPLTHDRYREFASLETTLRHRSGFVAHQVTRTWFVGSVFESSTQSIRDHLETMLHEIGHVYGFYDLYPSVRHRSDLDYLERWSVMHSAVGMPHVDAFHKREIGWLPEDPSPTERPGNEREMIVDEAILMAQERWDPALVADARAAFGESTDTDVLPVMELVLDAAGRQSVLIESRQSGIEFSKELPGGPDVGTEGRVLVTNATDPDDLLREVSRDLGYRRHLHLLKVLEDGDPEFDLGSLPKLAVGGTRIRVDGRAEIPTPDGPVVVFKISVQRDPAPFIELGFFDPLPNYLSTDVWIDWPGPDGSVETDDPEVFPVGEPSDQGDTIWYPPGDPPGLTEPHFIVARLRNAGDIRAEQVEVSFLVCEPAGSGDRSNFVEVDQRTVSVVPPLTERPDGVVVAGVWNVPPDASRHTCVRAEVVDWQLPERAPGDEGAIDDLTPDDNAAQKNIHRFEMLSDSPFEPVEFDYSVANDGPYIEHARLQTQGLAAGWRVTVSPAGRSLAPGQVGLFRCRIEADINVVKANCTADTHFSLVARRNAHVNEVPWGAVKYIAAPRKRARIGLRGGWSYGPLWFSGEIIPIPLGSSALARISFDDGERVWRRLRLRNGQFEFRAEDSLTSVPAESARVTVFYNGDEVFGAAESDELVLRFVTLI